MIGWLFVCMLAILAPLGLGHACAHILVVLAGRRERSWARQLPFKLVRHDELYSGFMTQHRRLSCWAITSSNATSGSIAGVATALAQRLDADAQVRWHDGQLELELPLPRTTSAWTAARNVHLRLHALSTRVLEPLHQEFPLAQVTLQSRM